jgi:large subunit ribosomal protein L21
MLAVIKTGGKQYLVSPGQKIKIEKLDLKEGKEVTFKEVLLVEKQKKVEIGTPFVKGAKVIGKVLKHGKGKKVIVFKYKSKTRYKVKKGHRQPFTEVEIVKIETGSKK